MSSWRSDVATEKVVALAKQEIAVVAVSDVGPPGPPGPPGAGGETSFLASYTKVGTIAFTAHGFKEPVWADSAKMPAQPRFIADTKEPAFGGGGSATPQTPPQYWS